MAHILVYTSPARGHLFPILGPALELAERGHEVRVVTLATEVERVRSLGLGAEPIASSIEDIEMDDYKAGSARKGLIRALRVFGERAPHDRDDLVAAIAKHQPDVLVVDNNSWGAQTAAAASGLPWAAFQPYLTPLPSKDVPPVGLGLSPDRGPIAKLRDRVLGAVMMRQFGASALPIVNELRAHSGLLPLSSATELLSLAPRTIYFTAEPFEYSRSDWPDSFVMVGPATWSPPASAPDWLDDVDRPIVLVTCSTERQDDRAILDVALAGLRDEDVFVVGTSAAQDPATFDAGPNARVEAFLPHEPIVDRAAVVVCHGGMGITQRALANGVPVCVVPFGRDQLEVARHVERADAGVRLPPRDLDAASLRAAVRQCRTLAPGAKRVAEGFASAGGSSRAADVVEELLGSPAPADPSQRRLTLGAAIG